MLFRWVNWVVADAVDLVMASGIWVFCGWRLSRASSGQRFGTHFSGCGRYRKSATDSQHGSTDGLRILEAQWITLTRTKLVPYDFIMMLDDIISMQHPYLPFTEGKVKQVTYLVILNLLLLAMP